MNNDIDLQTPDKAKIEEIIKIEWQMFQNVDNLGGRADCQDDFETFYIMRRSQYDNWTAEMVDAYSDFAARSQEVRPHDGLYRLALLQQAPPRQTAGSARKEFQTYKQNRGAPHLLGGRDGPALSEAGRHRSPNQVFGG